MANLNGTPDFGVVYQLETNDPVVGGTPNIGNGAGKSNIPHLQLLNMALWLKARLEGAGIGVDAPTTVNLSTLAATERFFSFASTAVGAPDIGVAYNGVGVNFGSPSGKLQIVSCTTSRQLLYRIADSGVANWQPWNDVLIAQRQISTAGLATGGGNLLTDLTITVSDATQAEAEAGTIQTKAMTPLRVAQAIAARLAEAFSAAVTIVGELTATRLRLTTTTDASLTSTGHAFQIGPDNGANMIIDINEIMARENGATARLQLQEEGGDLLIGGGTTDVEIRGTVSGSVLATQAEAETGAINNHIMTPLSVAQAIIARLAARTISTSGLATGGGALDANRTITVSDATQAEAEAGTISTKAMSPLRVAQAIAARLAEAFNAAVTIVGELTATRLRLTTTTDASLTSTGHAFQIGPDNGANMIIDINEIIARDNGAAATLLIQASGGNLSIGDATSDTTINGTISGAGVATQSQAQAGTVNDRVMTPQRVEQHMIANAFGWGQTWNNVTGNRAIGTSYQNTSGRPIMVSIDVSGNNATGALQVSANNSTWLTVANRDADGNAEWFSTVVPTGDYYRLTGTITITTWAELS